MADILPPTRTVTRTDYVRRSMIHLRCSACGTTTMRCHIDDAEHYLRLLSKHTCARGGDA